MDINKEAMLYLGAYRLPGSDIDHIFEYAGLTGNALSPYRYNAEQAASSSPSQRFQALAESPIFNKIARLLLEPDLKILFHSWGNATADQQYYAFLSAEDANVLALFINSRNEILMLHFPDWETYLQWWTTIYSTEGNGEYIRIFKDTTEIETLVCALHCIDTYRRAYMQSMLDFRSQVDISIHTHDFVQLMKNSLSSDDTRWLIPSMFELTPGLKNSSIVLQPEHLKKIEELGFVSCNAELLLTLDERSKTMGNEFLMTWMEAVGWQASALVNDEERILTQMFMAPTAFSNHLFSFETGADGKTRFSHQASNRYDLIKSMLDWMEDLRKVMGSISPEVKMDIPQGNICTKCGVKNRPGKKLCISCGGSLTAENKKR